jgi:hypothetical protein
LSAFGSLNPVVFVFCMSRNRDPAKGAFSHLDALINWEAPRRNSLYLVFIPETCSSR